jgi:2-polyprenyl-3-methyl-5-hydroxy-6-metoxy-1,4-benzoquinol methylase
MVEDRLYDDAALARFYDLDNGWTADRDYCLRLAKGCRSVLDLGCGTSALALSIATETAASVVAVDPARAMLDPAWAKPGAGAVRWVETDARLGRVEAWNDVKLDVAAQVATYETVYQAADGRVFRAT